MQPARGADVPAGSVELREDVPLKADVRGGAGCAGGGWCAAGPRLIAACFAVLTVAITLALLTQIYAGDYEVVPHGSVSSSASECSRAGTDALKAGGRALDAAVAAALCLAVVAPHRTSLDASGAMLYWEYRRWRSQPPELAEWGGVGGTTGPAGGGDARPPRLVAALAAMHARHGVLPWKQLLQTAVDLAKDGFLVSRGLATALAAEALSAGGSGDSGGGVEGGRASPAPGSLSAAPALAAYLHSLQNSTSFELSSAWGGEAALSLSSPSVVSAGSWRLLTPRAPAARALHLALTPSTPTKTTSTDPDELSHRVISELQAEVARGSWRPAGVATGLAVVDQFDTYLTLVTGVSVPFGSGPATAAGWTRDEPDTQLDLAPAILTDEYTCGTRYVLGAESSSALVQGAAALVAGGTAGGAAGWGAVEGARVSLTADGTLALEALRPPAPTFTTPDTALLRLNATPPYAALNVVQQRGDALLSHADSRGGGVASRF